MYNILLFQDQEESPQYKELVANDGLGHDVREHGFRGQVLDGVLIGVICTQR